MISVDGGINYETSKLVKNAGCDVVVVGTYLTRDIIKKEKVGVGYSPREVIENSKNIWGVYY